MLVHSKSFPTEADTLSLCFKKAYGRHAGVMQGIGVKDSSVILQLNKCYSLKAGFLTVRTAAVRSDGHQQP